jgi:glyoxylase-like metal-dependent hydrolase (beta-lactamase superfamily II)
MRHARTITGVKGSFTLWTAVDSSSLHYNCIICDDGLKSFLKKSFYGRSFVQHYMSQVIDARIDSNSHVFFIKGDKTAIFDTGAPGNERKILRALKDAGIPRERVSALIISHAHWDHCGSLQALKAMLDVPVMAGWPDAEYLEKGENVPNMSTPKNTTKLNFGRVKVDVVVRDDMDIHGYGIDARVMTTPAHTAGSLSVLASDGGCATGDFLAGLYTGERGVVEQSLKKLTDGGVKRFYPAHGPSVEAEAVLKIFFTP